MIVSCLLVFVRPCSAMRGRLLSRAHCFLTPICMDKPSLKSPRRCTNRSRSAVAVNLERRGPSTATSSCATRCKVEHALAALLDEFAARLRLLVAARLRPAMRIRWLALCFFEDRCFRCSFGVCCWCPLSFLRALTIAMLALTQSRLACAVQNIVSPRAQKRCIACMVFLGAVFVAATAPFSNFPDACDSSNAVSVWWQALAWLRAVVD